MIGLEPTLEEHIAKLVDVFREVRRVLRDDGTLFLNYGDAYAGGGRGGGSDGSKQQTNNGSLIDPVHCAGYKPKDLMMMPARVAMALQADGWWLRSEIVWHKVNPMPESMRDRPTQAHEKVFLFSLSGDALFWVHEKGAATVTAPDPDYIWIHRLTEEVVEEEPPDLENWRRRNQWRGCDYFYDQQAVRLPAKKTGTPGHLQSSANSRENVRRTPDAETKPSGWATSRYYHEDTPNEKKRAHDPGTPPRHEGYTNHTKLDRYREHNGANLRNVWSIPTFSYPGAHFATFPPALVEPCIKAGTSEHGVCNVCSQQYVRVIEKEAAPHDVDPNTKYEEHSRGERARRMIQSRRARGIKDDEGWGGETIGWTAPCECDGPVAQAQVLDPFGGSGTVGVVADRLQRNAVLIEINSEYVDLARTRAIGDAPLFADVEVET